MYLAEDRVSPPVAILLSLFLSYIFPQILCWELVSKRGGAWILHYVKSAYAVTDVPDQVCFFVPRMATPTLIFFHH